MTSEKRNKFHLFHTATAQAAPFHIEADRVVGGISMLISGVLGVNEFSDTSVLLKLRGMYIRINGSSLCLTVYENKTVEIVGNILLTEYSNDKTR